MIDVLTTRLTKDQIEKLPFRHRGNEGYNLRFDNGSAQVWYDAYANKVMIRKLEGMDWKVVREYEPT